MNPPSRPRGMAARPGRPLALLTAWLLALTSLLPACQDEPPRRYHHPEAPFSIIFPRGWTVFEEPTENCPASAGARAPDGTTLLLCAGDIPPGVFTTRNDYLVCEELKLYLAETVKGHNIDCSPSLIQGRRVYDARYRRFIRRESGVETQFVIQTFTVFRGRLYTITSYALGADDAAARTRYERHASVILGSVATFFLHPDKAH